MTPRSHYTNEIGIVTRKLLYLQFTVLPIEGWKHSIGDGWQASKVFAQGQQNPGGVGRGGFCPILDAESFPLGIRSPSVASSPLSAIFLRF